MNKETINLGAGLCLPCSRLVEVAASGGKSEVTWSWSCNDALSSGGGTSWVGP